MDLVIIIDQSLSMRSKRQDNGTLKGNDINGYRIDAASIMLSMCDVEDSRAAIVLFNGKTTFYGNTSELTFYNISGNAINNRYDMISWLNGQRDSTSNDTDIGLAVTCAKNLI